jgi:hypothetical protein
MGMSRRAEAKPWSAEPKALTDSEYRDAGIDFVRAVSKMNSVEITVEALQRIRREKPPGTPMDEWFFGQNMTDIIEQEKMYLNLLRSRAINIDGVLETEKLRRQLKDISKNGSLDEDRSKYECWQGKTDVRANRRRMSRPWNIGEGCRFDGSAMSEYKIDTSTLHLRVHWIAKRIKNLEIVMDRMGDKAPEILRDIIDDGRCLTWLLITDRGGMEESVISIRSRANTPDSSESSGKKKQ